MQGIVTSKTAQSEQSGEKARKGAHTKSGRKLQKKNAERIRNSQVFQRSDRNDQNSVRKFGTHTKLQRRSTLHDTDNRIVQNVKYTA